MSFKKNSFAQVTVERGENIDQEDIEDVNKYLEGTGVSLSLEDDEDYMTIKIFKEE